MLHVVGDHGDGVVFFQLGYQFFDVGGGNRVECGSGLVEQHHFGLVGHGARDAQALLLAAGERVAALLELVFHFAPQRGFAQSPFHAVVQFAFAQLFVKLHAEGDVVVNRHGKRRGLLKHHAHFGAQEVQVDIFAENVFIVQQQIALGFHARIKVVHAVEGAQQGGFSAAGGADKGGDFVGGNIQIDVFQRVERAVVKVEIAHGDFGFHCDSLV